MNEPIRKCIEVTPTGWSVILLLSSGQTVQGRLDAYAATPSINGPMNPPTWHVELSEANATGRGTAKLWTVMGHTIIGFGRGPK